MSSVRLFKKEFCFSSHVYLWYFFVLDVVTKRLAWTKLQQPLVLCDYLTFELSINHGISWGMLSSNNPYVFGAVTAAVGLFLLFFTWTTYVHKKPGSCILPELLIIIGGVSNFLDRIVYGGVIDFMHFHYQGWSFPTFNVADVCIVLGAFLLVKRVVFKNVSA